MYMHVYVCVCLSACVYSVSGDHIRALDALDLVSQYCEAMVVGAMTQTQSLL